jgi:hypothetical protein
MDYVAKVSALLTKAGFDPSRLAGKTQQAALDLLLAAAEDATSTPEAQAFTAKAAEIMADRSINAAMLAAAQQGDAPRVATDDRIGPMGTPFQHQRKDLANAIGRALRLHPVIKTLPGIPGKYRAQVAVDLFGARQDIDRAKVLFDSTMLQGFHVMSCELTSDRLGRNPGSSDKQSWLQGWAAGVGHVLDLAEHNARTSYDQEHKLEAGKGTELVLADWDVIILAHRAKLYPHLSPARARSTSGNQFSGGFRAGTQANVNVARTAGALTR